MIDDERERNEERVRRGEERTTGGTEGERSAAGAVGGAVGAAAAGAAGGTVTLGPIGTIIGATAGSLGGWWAGLGASTTRVPRQDEEGQWQKRYESAPHPADRGYEDVRLAYHLGWLARQNPEYAGMRFDEIEPALTRAWSDEMRERYGDWEGMRGYVRDAFELAPEPKPRAAPRDPLLEDRIRELQSPMPPEERR